MNRKAKKKCGLCSDSYLINYIMFYYFKNFGMLYKNFILFFILWDQISFNNVSLYDLLDTIKHTKFGQKISIRVEELIVWATTNAIRGSNWSWVRSRSTWHLICHILFRWQCSRLEKKKRKNIFRMIDENQLILLKSL